MSARSRRPLYTATGGKLHDAAPSYGARHEWDFDSEMKATCGVTGYPEKSKEGLRRPKCKRCWS